jgi:hypothetical protein
MNKMIMLAMVITAMLLMVGCVQKHCYRYPPENQLIQASAGSPILLKKDCFGRVTVNQCYDSSLFYLGSTGSYLRIGQKGSYGQMVEFTFPVDQREIPIQDARFEVIKNNDIVIGFKLIEISKTGCDKVIESIK